MSNPIELKIKAISLGQEISTIKKEEKQQLRLQRRYLNSKYRQRLIAERREAEASRNDIWNFQFHTIMHHRKRDLKPEARATNIARGFLRGLPYNVIETFPNDVGNQKINYLLSKKRSDGHYWSGPNWKRILRLIEKYGDSSDLSRLHPWLAVNGLGISLEGEVVSLQ
jgi:hypothetical protein